MPHLEYPEDDPIIAIPPTGPRVRLSTPRDIAAAVPQLLGFHPTNSLVVIFIRDRIVTATARLDLPPPEAADGIWPALAGGLIGSKADAVLLIAYADRAADPVLFECVRTCPVLVVEALRIDDRRMWVPTCTGGSDCCPPGALLDPTHTSILAPMMIHAGVSVAGSRQELAACLQPAADEVIARVAKRLEFFARQPAGYPGKMAKYTQLDRARRERLNGQVPLEEMRGAFLLHCLGDHDVRDACCSWGDPGWLLWLDLIPLAPPSHVPIVACLIGIHAYQHGDGAMAIVAAQHALTTDPTYSFAELIIELTQTAITPAEASIELKATAQEALDDLRRSDPQVHYPRR
jgi:uncharacterized protein DUF4192